MFRQGPLSSDLQITPAATQISRDILRQKTYGAWEGQQQLSSAFSFRRRPVNQPGLYNRLRSKKAGFVARSTRFTYRQLVSGSAASWPFLDKYTCFCLQSSRGSACPPAAVRFFSLSRPVRYHIAGRHDTQAGPQTPGTFRSETVVGVADPFLSRNPGELPFCDGDRPTTRKAESSPSLSGEHANEGGLGSVNRALLTCAPCSSTAWQGNQKKKR